MAAQLWGHDHITAPAGVKTQSGLLAVLYLFLYGSQQQSNIYNPNALSSVPARPRAASTPGSGMPGVYRYWLSTDL